MSRTTRTSPSGNRLLHETSPYLLQHAHNPVDWYPWGAEALERAQRENKPILVSIGYSACHWCHVMEHESFQDEEVARVMNEYFVCIKVDREERPDLDKIYQTAHQILAQRPGGWPLNMFLTPDDQMPFFGGTYFPKTAKHGLPAFTDLLRHVAEVYAKKLDAIREQNHSLHDIFRRLQPPEPTPGQHPGPTVLEAAYRELQQQFDPRFGGFGRAPKFPHPTSLAVCLHRWAGSRGNKTEDAEALHLTTLTLERMAEGGLFDQVGGGFYRYSVDDRWEIPHFEKMLYDNAQLLMLYVDAWQATGNSLFQRIATETAEWVVREMQSPDGGYYSSLDADSEGQEGKFYIWTNDAIRSLLTHDEWDLVERRFGLNATPNFEGHWHLNVRADNATVAEQTLIAESDVQSRWGLARQKLFNARAKRVRPGRDEKILTSWNGLMIQAMARAGRALGRADFVQSATRAMDFIYARLWRNQRLLVTHKDGKSHLNAYLDDYVYMIAAAMEILQSDFRVMDLDFSMSLANCLLEHFEDERHGGFYFTGDDHEKLVYRPKPITDDALPSGNGIAAWSLGRLGHLIGDLNYVHAAERTVESLYNGMQQQPSTHGAMLLALEETFSPPQTIILRGSIEAMRPWQALAAAAYQPARMVLAIPDDAKPLPKTLADKVNRAEVTAYVCSGHSCSPPVTDLAEYTTLLS